MATVMDGLIAFIRSAQDARLLQLDEDERVARATRFQTWRAERSERSVYADESSVVRPEDEDARDYEYIVPPDSEGSEGIEPAVAVHIARWDPARVLEEVDRERKRIEAERRILDECASIPGDGANFTLAEQDRAAEIIRQLAQPYAGYPGWREE